MGWDGEGESYIEYFISHPSVALCHQPVAPCLKSSGSQSKHASWGLLLLPGATLLPFDYSTTGCYWDRLHIFYDELHLTSQVLGQFQAIYPKSTPDKKILIYGTLGTEHLYSKSDIINGTYTPFIKDTIITLCSFLLKIRPKYDNSYIII